MPTANLTFNDPNFGLAQEIERRVYRSESPMDPNNLPTPLATLPPDTLSYVDNTVLDGVIYYYRLADVLGAEIAVSAEYSITISGTASPVTTFSVTTSSRTMAATETDFPFVIPLNLMPASFWSEVLPGGENIRVYADSGLGSMIPHFVADIDPIANTGYLHVKADLQNAGTTFYVALTSDTARLAETDPNGSRAVFSKFAGGVVFLGGWRAGNEVDGQEAICGGEPQLLELVQTTPVVTGHDGAVITPAGNLLANDNSGVWRLYSDPFGTPTLIQTFDASAAATTAISPSVAFSSCGGPAYGPDGRLYAFFGNNGASTDYGLASFDLDETPGSESFSLVTGIDVSTAGYIGFSSCCFKGEELIGVNYVGAGTTSLYRVNASTGALIGTIEMNSAAPDVQGICWVPPGNCFYLNSDNGREVYYVTEDGFRSRGGAWGDNSSGNAQSLQYLNNRIYRAAASGNSMTVQEWRVRDTQKSGGGGWQNIAGAYADFVGLGSVQDFTLLGTCVPETFGVNNQPLISYHDESAGAANTRATIHFFNFSGNNNRFWLVSATTPGSMDTLVDVTLGTPYRYAATFESGVSEASYRDGALTNSQAIGSLPTTFDHVLIGREDDDGSAFIGELGRCIMAPLLLSSDWIEAEWDMLDDPASFYSIVDVTS